ncbi:MAG: (d)CMP kinase [Planctomycetota bacterium]
MIITIDGPAGTGKSTVAHGLARRLGLDFLDTGAMYRAAALVAIRRGIDPEDGPALAAAVEEADLHFDWSADPPRMMLGEDDVSDEIRTLEVSRIVSTVAARREVRAVLVARQRLIARRHPRLVSEGRDQGSVVFPTASLRFYLDADVAVRAERRAMQLSAAGRAVDRQSVIDDIRRRDELDATRRAGPLVRPEGAIDIDTGLRSADAVVALMESVARERLPEAGFDE